MQMYGSLMVIRFDTTRLDADDLAADRLLTRVSIPLPPAAGSTPPEQLARIALTASTTDPGHTDCPITHRLVAYLTRHPSGRRIPVVGVGDVIEIHRRIAPRGYLRQPTMADQPPQRGPTVVEALRITASGFAEV